MVTFAAAGRAWTEGRFFRSLSPPPVELVETSFWWLALGAAEWAAPRPARAQLVRLVLSSCRPWQGTCALHARHTRTGCSPLRFLVASLPAFSVGRACRDPAGRSCRPPVGRSCRPPVGRARRSNRWSSLSRPFRTSACEVGARQARPAGVRPWSSRTWSVWLDHAVQAADECVQVGFDGLGGGHGEVAEDVGVGLVVE